MEGGPGSASLLVLRIRAGDAEAEVELVVRYRAALVRLLRRQTGDAALAEDLAQDTLLITIDRLRRGKLHEPAALPAFVRSIATNLLRAERRKQRRRRTDALDDVDEPAAAAADPLAAMVETEERRLLRRAIASLPSERDREVLRRTYLDGESRESVRDHLGLPELRFNTVLYRARERLRKAIQTIFHDGLT
jgi:RNA polymerase sigma-70 factor (ECF subfamily)